MFQTDVGGRVELRRVQGLLAGADKELQRALAKNTREAIAPIKEEIPAEALKRMPHRYGAVLAKAVKVTARVTAGTTVKAVVKVSASGKRQDRDVRARDLGSLRHPIYGRYRRLKSGKRYTNPWDEQRVRRGFVADPIEATRRRVIKGAKDAADKTADTIAKG